MDVRRCDFFHELIVGREIRSWHHSSRTNFFSSQHEFEYEFSVCIDSGTLIGKNYMYAIFQFHTSTQRAIWKIEYSESAMDFCLFVSFTSGKRDYFNWFLEWKCFPHPDSHIKYTRSLPSCISLMWSKNDFSDSNLALQIMHLKVWKYYRYEKGDSSNLAWKYSRNCNWNSPCELYLYVKIVRLRWENVHYTENIWIHRAVHVFAYVSWVLFRIWMSGCKP